MNMDDLLRRPDGRSMYYILEGHEVVPATSWEQWAQWMGENKYALADPNTGPCRVASTHIEGLWVSTVFLGIDHGWRGEPLLFETMVFDETDGEVDFGVDHEQDRYSSWTEAEAGHVAMVEWVRAHIAEPK